MSSCQGPIGSVEISSVLEGQCGDSSVLEGQCGDSSVLEGQCGDSSVEWKIAHFWSYTRYGEKSFKSDSFECAGKRWHMKLEISSTNSISVDLVPELSLQECFIRFKLVLKKADGTFKSDKKWITYSSERSCEYGSFLINKSDLKRCWAQLVPSGVITFVCCFTSGKLHNVLPPASIIHAIPQRKRKFSELVDASTQTQSENCTEKLSRDINELLLSGEDSNLIVQVKGVEFRLHRGIMGVRTPVFAAMLKHSMKKKTSGIVSINDCEVEVFQEFVHYLYNGRVHELSANTAFELFALADKYQVDELKSVCFEFIRGSLSVDTFCDVVTLALTYSKRQLLQQATDFFAQNMEEILETVKWMNFIKHNVIQANNLILTAVKKIKQ